MSQGADLLGLPAELLLHVARFLDIRDLSSFSLVNRHLHWRFLYLLFDSAVTERSDPVRPERCLVGLLFHAVKHDSKNIAQYLIYSPHHMVHLNLKGSTRSLYSTKQFNSITDARKRLSYREIILSALPPEFTFLHLALLADAPRVAADLIKMGADISQEIGAYPDLTPLYLTLPRSLASSPKELDTALRIACSYALPRTTHFLLARGANPNTKNAYGTAAIHTAVMRRRPWRGLSAIDYFLTIEFDGEDSRWESMLLQTVSALLNFGAEVEFQTETSRTHECDPECWQSIDCDHQGQTALHLAAAAGILSIVSHLLDVGANPDLPNGQGYTALYGALVQGHKDIACHILEVCEDPVNPIVCMHEQTTALHIACRFSFSKIVGVLLNGGAYVNVVDSQGRTPLHDVLMGARLGREEEVIHTLNHLDKFGANPDINTYHQTPRQIAEAHELVRVRDMFLAPQAKPKVRRTRRTLSIDLSSELPEDVRSGARYSIPKRGPSDLKSQYAAEGTIFFDEDFPRLVCSENDQLKAGSMAQTDPVCSMFESCSPIVYKAAQFGNFFDASTPSPNQDDINAPHEQTPKNLVPSESSRVRTVPSTPSIWSDTTTSKLVKGLEMQSLPPKQLQKPVEAFPALGQPHMSQTSSVPSGLHDTEATQFWSGLTRPVGGSGAVSDMSGEKKEGSGGQTARTKTGRDRNKKRWTALQF